MTFGIDNNTFLLSKSRTPQLLGLASYNILSQTALGAVYVWMCIVLMKKNYG